MQYKCVNIGFGSTENAQATIQQYEDLLNELAQEGWHFVSIETVSYQTRTKQGCLKPDLVHDHTTRILIVSR